MKRVSLVCIFLFFSDRISAQLYSGFTDFDQNNDLYLFINAGAGNLWQIGIPDKPYLSSAYSSPNVIITDTVNAYPVNDTSVFQILMPYSFVGFGSELRFNHRYQTDSLKDGGYLEFSHDLGQTWYNATNDSAYLQEGGIIELFNFYTESDTLTDGTPAFSGTSGTWKESVVNFGFLCVSPERISDTILVRFVFRSDSVANSFDGWMIDDVTVIEYVCSGINEVSNSFFDFSVYPNPADEVVSVLLSKSLQTKAVIEIRDMRSKLLKEIEISGGKMEYYLDIGNLPTGMYEISIRTAQNFYSKKLLKGG